MTTTKRPLAIPDAALEAAMDASDPRWRADRDSTNTFDVDRYRYARTGMEDALAAAYPAIREAVIHELLDQAANMHTLYGFDDDKGLMRYSFESDQFEPFSVYGWLVDCLDAVTEADDDAE